MSAQKPKTYFIDIDGTIFEHLECGASQQWYDANLNVINKSKATLDMIEAAGDMIVLVTARPEHTRDSLVAMLLKNGIIYHRLIMGVTSGERVIVNDYTNAKPVACSAINVKRNAGFVLHEECPSGSRVSPERQARFEQAFPPGTKCILRMEGKPYLGIVIPIDDKYPDAVRNARTGSRLFMKDGETVPTLCDVGELISKDTYVR